MATEHTEKGISIDHQPKKSISLIERPLVLKIGGSILGNHLLIMESIKKFYSAGITLILVHGGGNDATDALNKLKIKSTFKNGRRITTAEVLEVVMSVFGEKNAIITQQLVGLNIPAEGISHPSYGLLEAVTMDPSLFFVGGSPSVNKELLYELIGQGKVPVIAPLGLNKKNRKEYLNINGDTAAGPIARALGGNLIIISNINGILDNTGGIIQEMTLSIYRELRGKHVIDQGAIPKVLACFDASNGGGTAVICSMDALRQSADTLLLPQGTIIKPFSLPARRK